MTKRDPRDVLGVEADASPTQIKAAWRRLARTNHPDLTGDDPAASRAATRRMAEINDAYAALTRDTGRRGGERRSEAANGAPFEPG
ncbi:MAG TPA: J domain-containing protein, partial [Candidatus Limnocylindrales bacterium]|nr:J domain-containing protein [Candidatus Limnocylindrales bacterium]